MALLILRQLYNATIKPDTKPPANTGSRPGKRAISDHGADHQQAQQHHHAGNHDHRRGKVQHRLVGLAVFRVDHRGGRAGDKPPEEAQQWRAIARSHYMQCGVTGEADAGDQHHHQPGLVRIECVIGAEILVGQDRQHDEGEHGELQHGDEIAAGQPL